LEKVSDSRAWSVAAPTVPRPTALVGAVVVLLLPGGAGVAQANTDCSLYAQPRVFLESQSWWKRMPGTRGSDFGHVHTGTCFPYLQSVRGIVRFDVVTKLHDNPGTLTRVDVQAFNDAYGTKRLVSTAPELVCPTSDCTVTHRLNADTGVLAYDGLTEFRVRSHVREPDGNVSLSTDGWLAYVRNGKPVADTRYLAPDRIEGRGWYGAAGTDGLGYVNARLLTRLPATPVSGTWRPEVQTLPGAGPSSPVSRTLVTVDPDFHAMPERRGWVQIDQSGAFKGPLAIDTTKLANGPHKLAIVASADHGALGSTQSGVQVVPFTVAN
jgi:hypothetical protein